MSLEVGKGPVGETTMLYAAACGRQRVRARSVARVRSAVACAQASMQHYYYDIITPTHYYSRYAATTIEPRCRAGCAQLRARILQQGILCPPIRQPLLYSSGEGPAHVSSQAPPSPNVHEKKVYHNTQTQVHVVQLRMMSILGVLTNRNSWGVGK